MIRSTVTKRPHPSRKHIAPLFHWPYLPQCARPATLAALGREKVIIKKQTTASDSRHLPEQVSAREVLLLRAQPTYSKPTPHHQGVGGVCAHCLGLPNKGEQSNYHDALNCPRQATPALKLGRKQARIQPQSGSSALPPEQHDPTYHFWRPVPAGQSPVAGLASVARMRDRAAAITGRTVSRPAAPGCRLSADVFGRRPAARRECVSPISSRPCGSQIPDVAVAPSRSSKDSTWQSV